MLLIVLCWFCLTCAGGAWRALYNPSKKGKISSLQRILLSNVRRCWNERPRRGFLLGTSYAALLPSLALSRPESEVPACFIPAPGRIVAVGDIHGDCDAFERVLRASGLYDRTSGWIGGNAVLVQIGDVLDRGDQELECLMLLRELKREAPKHGGTVISLLGNHEIMNAAGVSYMASPRSAARFGNRETAFLPGSSLAEEIASWPVACIVGDTVFCHASLTLAQVEAGLDVGNAAAAEWLRGKGNGRPPEFLFPRDSESESKSPLWTRQLSKPADTEPSAAACADLKLALQRLGCQRLVVGHTVQSQINCACSCSVYRIDVGLSSAMAGASSQALEISQNGKVRVLTASHGSELVARSSSEAR